MKDTSIWPIQKFSWKDLTAPKGKTFTYHIIPMVGMENNLKPIANKDLWLQTDPISLTPGAGPIKAYFNRGILSTQFLARQLSKGKTGKPNLGELKAHIAKIGDPIRVALAGEFLQAVPSLLNKVIQEGGMCYLALYELTDPELIQILIKAKNNLDLILTNAGEKGSDDENAPARKKLKAAGVSIHDRFVPSGHIGHDKFCLYTDETGTPHTVLTGSTNWTQNALCAQSNNTLIIEDPKLAQAFSDFWDRLLADTNNNDSKQGATLRHSNQRRFPNTTANIGVWFSPNTASAKKPAAGSIDIDTDPNQPLDLKDMFEAIEGAQKSILFLEYQPGSPSVLDKILSVQQRKPNLFIRGAATDSKAVGDYNTALFHGDSAIPDVYSVVAASAIGDAFSYWEAELLSAGHAIIHDKIVVIDPFTDNCRVFTGSHNHGYRASAFNDENLVSVRGNKEMAAAYAAHVIDVYDHYRFRYLLLIQGKTGKKSNAFSGLETTDAWQDKYFMTVGQPAVTHMTVPNPNG